MNRSLVAASETQPGPGLVLETPEPYTCPATIGTTFKKYHWRSPGIVIAPSVVESPLAMAESTFIGALVVLEEALVAPLPALSTSIGKV